MPKYYVGKKSQLTGFHAVHKQSCPLLPEQDNRVYLGEFDNGRDAINRAKILFTYSTGCIFCSREIARVTSERYFEWNAFSVS